MGQPVYNFVINPVLDPYIQANAGKSFTQIPNELKEVMSIAALERRDQ
jgi:FMN-dependent NADH-azoreductase